ncbi:MAG: hypothetical protein NTX36_12300 [Proteobacteria bacterium]|nr:hypothetical protein [Pseudomonadota bacterium]
MYDWLCKDLRFFAADGRDKGWTRKRTGVCLALLWTFTPGQLHRTAIVGGAKSIVFCPHLSSEAGGNSLFLKLLPLCSTLYAPNHGTKVAYNIL